MTVSSMLYNSFAALAVLFISALAVAFGLYTNHPTVEAVAIGGLFAAFLWMAFVTLKRTYSLRSMLVACRKISDGDMEARIILTKEKDPQLLALGNAVNDVVDRVDAYVRESVAMFEHAAQDKFYRKIMLTGMTGAFRHGSVTLNTAVDAVRANAIGRMTKAAGMMAENVENMIRSLDASAQQMMRSAEDMRRVSQQTAEISETVAASAVEASSNVNTVAAATEELTASSAEISRQVDSVARQAGTASADAGSARALAEELNVMANSIGEVVSTIKDIADQTNLLALNATIEAARAGEAGKGFAVVAGEVKKLATETAARTGQIDERVAAIQQAIHKSVGAMGQIIDNVRTIDTATTSVAGAVEQQNAATGEIGRNVQEASIGTQQVTQAIGQVQENAAQTGTAAENVLRLAGELQAQMKRFQEQVEAQMNDFVRSVEAA